MRITLLPVSLFIGFFSCQPQSESLAPVSSMEIVHDTLRYRLDMPDSKDLYDKVLGSLVGSAIGDAMGAPTEMWGRQEREESYGYVDDLDPSFIDPSPEGLWDFHLPPGTTTDDTRWKSLAGNFVIQELNSFYKAPGPDPYDFARHILSSYQLEVKRLKETPDYDPMDIDHNMRRLTWLQEWAMVAEPFSNKDLEGYTTALHRFYGGDLLCAGMLYAPAIGLPYPGDALAAYNAAHRLGIFDQGYARDITGLTAAMVAAAMAPNATKNTILEVFRTVDPYDYFRSRLFGREAFKTYRAAVQIAKTSKNLRHCDSWESDLGLSKTDSLNSCRLNLAFKMLDQRNQHSPAHAQEILLVTLTAMLYADFEFQTCMEFIVNYGRDNDTSGAVAGSILGAYLGYDKLPESIKEQVLKTNRENLGIDLEKLARDIADQMMDSA